MSAGAGDSASRAEFDRLVAAGAIAVRRSSFFDTALPSEGLVDFDRIEGMLLGLAIGDALGNTSEGLLPLERRARYGQIIDYLPNRYASGRAVGLPSDDSQLAFWTLEQLVEDGAFIPDRLAERFASRQVFGIGSTVREFQRRYAAGAPWWQAGVPDGAGNGALMRIAPMVIPHVANPGPALWADTALSAMVTHNGSAAIASCIAFVALLAELLRAPSPPPAEWWFERMIDVMQAVETGETYEPRGGTYAGYTGTLGAFTEHVVADAWQRRISTQQACDEWYSGAYVLETVPSVLYILMMHADDAEQAIVRAVNDTKDNDTIGAIVGAAVGALHGGRALPERWVSSLLGRTAGDDDGRVFELVQRAKAVFGPARA